MRKEITKEMIKQAKQDLEECDKNNEIVPVYFNQQKLRLYDIINFPQSKVIMFVTIPFDADDQNFKEEDMQFHSLSLEKEYDVLHIIRCFDSISYELRGPNLDIIWIIEEYLDASSKVKSREESQQLENWLNAIKDKDKVKKVKDILLYWEKYETKGPLIDQYIENSDNKVINERGTIFDVVDASDEKYPNIRFGFYYKTPKKRVLARYIEATNLNRAGWYIR